MSIPSCSGCSESSADSLLHPERRQLLKQGALAAVVTMLSGAASACARAVAPAAQSQATPIGAWALRIHPADFPALANVGGIARVDGESDKPVAVVRTDKGFSAFSLRCPHAGATVEPKDGMFVCPGHGAEFKATGAWSGGHRARDLTSLATTYDEASKTLTITA